MFNWDKIWPFSALAARMLGLGHQGGQDGEAFEKWEM